MQHQGGPNCQRVPQDDGTSKTLKMSIGKKKLHAHGQEGMARMMYASIIINGAQYCRRHLMIRCHLCQEDSWFLKEEGDDARSELGLRDSGDPRLNERARYWTDFIISENMQKKMKVESLIQKYGRDHGSTHPQHWHGLTREWGAEERQINDRFLAENDDVIRNKGASQCCYWACETPSGADGKKLLKCTGCGIAKYCCKEHQALDWRWEHKGECTLAVPDWFKQEIEQDRQRNLNGDYEDYK